MDVGKAWSVAQGAVWHLEVALPELQAATRAGETRSDLISSAAHHVERAVEDLASARVTAGELGSSIGDAQLGAQLADAAAGIRAAGESDGLQEASSVIRGARADAHAGVVALTPHLRSSVSMLKLSPAADAPRSELQLVRDAASARAFHAVSDVQRHALRDLLERGTIDPEPVGWVGGYGNGNGAMPIVRVVHPDTPHIEQRAVQRPPTAQAAQEEFFSQLAANLGVDQHYIPAVRRSDGSALVPLVEGQALWDAGVEGADDVGDVMASWYRMRFPQLPDDQAALAGRIDRETAQMLDFITAQPDRNNGGALADRASGSFWFLDNGFAGRGETHDVLRPGLRSQLIGSPQGLVELHEDSVQQLRALATDDAIASAHSLLSRPAGDLPAGHAESLRQDALPAFVDRMQARRDHVLATGSYSYEPIDRYADPLAHMRWLRGE